MQFRTGISLLAMAAITPFAYANNDGADDLDTISLPALQGEAKVTFKPGSGFTVDGGDDYKLNLSNRLQIQWRYANRDKTADQMTFRGRRLRTKLKGHVFSKATRYMVYLEWASAGGNSLDVFIEQDLWENEEWALTGRAGQMKTLYGKEAAGSSGNLMFVERSLATRTFADTRATGALAQLKGMDDHLFVHFGIFNAGTASGSAFASGHLTQNADNEPNYTVGGRYEFGENMGDLGYDQGDLSRSEEMQASVHGNIWIGNERGTIGGTTSDVDIFSYNVGGALKTGGISVLAEYFGWNGDPDVSGASTDQDAGGWNVQGTYSADDNWSFGARVSMVDIDTAASVGATSVGLIGATSAGSTGAGTALVGKGDVTEFSLGVSRFYNAHKRKLQADITFQSVDPDTGTSQDNIIFRVMATLAI